MPDRAVPGAAATGGPAPAGDVPGLFERIAPIYDAMNTVMTAGIDARWRRAAAEAAALGPGMRAVDVACGTGALTRELAARVGETGSVTGIDLSTAMLRKAARRRRLPGAGSISYERGDALALPIADASVDAATIAFGLRNVSDHRRAIDEMRRVTRPGGRVVVLEIAMPSGRVGRLVSATWFERVVPLLGRLLGHGAAYRYLPESVRRYPPPEAIAATMAEAGLIQVRWRPMAFGMVTLHVGRRPGTG